MVPPAFIALANRHERVRRSELDDHLEADVIATGQKAAKKATKKVAKNAATAVKKTAPREVTKKRAVESMLDSATKHVKKLVRAAKRTLIEPTPGDKRFVRRNSEGKFKDVVDVGKSLSADKRTTAKKVVKPGQGDKGDVKK